MRRPRQVQRRLTAKQVTKLVSRYRHGESVPQLAAEFGINRTTVLAHLERHGVPRRAQLRELTDEQVREAAVMYSEGQSTAAVGARFGVDASTLRRELKKAGVQLRTAARRRL